MIKRLLRLAVLAAIASAVATAIKAKRTMPADDAGSSPSVDDWPEVPRNPATS
jgi:hypothetical protein